VRGLRQDDWRKCIATHARTCGQQLDVEYTISERVENLGRAR
jgi:hypothetical protein